jgi:hypothetical protein
MVGFRTIGATTDRVAQSHDAQLLSFWLLPDLQSTPFSGIAATTDCTNVTGTTVLNLRWPEQDVTGAITYDDADYTTSIVGGQTVLQRWTCNTSNTTADSLTVVHNLASSNPVVVTCQTQVGAPASSCGLPAAVLLTMRVTTVGSASQVYTFGVTGGGRHT